MSDVIGCVLRSPVDLLYIVDNSPHDTLANIQSLSSRLYYIHSPHNVGYGSAHNIAIRNAIEQGSRYHVVVNPDIHFDDTVIPALTAYVDSNPDVGLVMPRVVYPNGDLQYLCKLLPTPRDLILRRFMPRNMGRKSRDRYELRHWSYDCEANIPSLSGCFMFLSLQAINDVGMFDERYFMYGEDIDLSRRIHDRYKTMYYPGVTIVHDHQQASYHNAKMLRIHIANIIKYFNKWGWFFDRQRRIVNRQCLNNLNNHDSI